MNTVALHIDNDQSARDLAEGKRVLQVEIDGVRAVMDGLDGDFARAVETIHCMKTTKPGGRLIVAGIGKSGHIARKLAATLASTGTPAYFVHAAEASHGDLGMITDNDVVLLLSNSGESAELSDLIAYTRRFSIPLIAMTAKAESALGKHADIRLLVPKMPEACPNNQAPTTSTTMMLALGDALAMALLNRMGLTAEQFKIFHPGGKLGQKLRRVADLMHPLSALPLITMDATMDRAVIALTEKNLGCVLVADDKNHLIGIITDGDLKRHMAPDLLQKKVSDIMSGRPRTIAPDALAVEALDLMTKTPGHYVTSLVVMDGETIAGLIRVQDCLQAGVA
jgi:arabinose-5-phosphate isomerase